LRQLTKRLVERTLKVEMSGHLEIEVPLDRNGSFEPLLVKKRLRRLAVFFDYSPEIRKLIHTTNAIESLNYSLRRLLKNATPFPTMTRS
jgi:transposase-like protein